MVGGTAAAVEATIITDTNTGTTVGDTTIVADFIMTGDAHLTDPLWADEPRLYEGQYGRPRSKYVVRYDNDTRKYVTGDKWYYRSNTLTEATLREANQKKYIWYNASTTATVDWGWRDTAADYCDTLFENWGNTLEVVYRNGQQWHVMPQAPLSPEEKLRQIIAERRAPAIHVARDRKAMRAPQDDRELCARQTLRKLIGEEGYARFLRNGFVPVRAKSGLVYQIFPGHDFTKVYRNGQLIEELCVVFAGSFPPTDSLIMRYLVILNDEQEFRSHAAKHGLKQPSAYRVAEPDQRPLTEIFRELKAKQAA